VIRSEKTDRENTLWWTRITASVPRCHLLGAMTAVVLLACIAWVGSRSRLDPKSIQYGDTLVDLADAATLIDNADRWRQLYTVNYRRSQTIDSHAASIADWLPMFVDWPAAERDIRSLGQSASLKVLSIEKGNRYVGTRVGVLSARCDVQGTYASVCRFLSGLSSRELPIACNQIELHRINAMAEGNLDHPTPLCRATLSLRIPYAADGTAAARLFTSETQHDS
jgi:hypothetical protein